MQNLRVNQFLFNTNSLIWFRISCLEVFCKKGVLSNFAKFTGKHLCQRLLLINLQASHILKQSCSWTLSVQLHVCLSMCEACNFIKKECLAQIFSCEFCEISKNTFFYRSPPVVAFVGCTSFDSETNTHVLNPTIDFILFTESFEEPLFYFFVFFVFFIWPFCSPRQLRFSVHGDWDF